jgi:hypothetical protein
VAVLAICTWLWGSAKYTPIYVERLHAGLRKNLQQPFRFLLMTERERKITLSDGIERYAIEDPQLTNIKGCFVRLRMFDKDWQRKCSLDGPIVCMDLDVVVTGSLDEVFGRHEPIVLFSGANSANPCPYNNSVFMFQAGAHSELWDDFSLDVLKKLPRYKFPDDQGWFWHRLHYPATWQVGVRSGIYAFRKPGWPIGDILPAMAKLVAFPGHRDPAQFTNLPWVRQYWVNSCDAK